MLDMPNAFIVTIFSLILLVIGGYIAYLVIKALRLYIKKNS